MHKTIVSLLLAATLLASCGTLEISLDSPAAQATASAEPSATAVPLLSMESTSEEIRHAMLVSATKWRTLFLDGIVTWYDPTGAGRPPQVFRQQVWIDQMNFRFRYLNGPADGEADSYRSSDGNTVLAMDLKSGQSERTPLPDFVKADPQFVPTVSPDTAYPQPLWGQMGAPLGELAYPSDFAQGEGAFAPVAIEVIAGRQCLAVDWTREAKSVPAFRAWLDRETAVILKQQTFSEEGENALTGESVVNEVVFDAPLEDSLFGAPASTPRFSNISGTPASPGQPGQALPWEQDPLGELYFFTLPHSAGGSVQLVRLPGSCVTGEVACPQIEPVEAPFPYSFNLSPLSWSPDGRLAAFAYPDDPDGTPFKLWLFDPAAGSWTSIAQFPYIDPPYWSPDGTWIAFRQQDGQGGEDVYVIRRDGTGLKNLTASGKLPPESRPYVMDGWLTESIVVRSALPGNEGSVYLVRASDGAVRPMFQTLLTKGTFFPSHDGSFLAFDNYDYNSQKHVLQITEPDGAHPVDLASFSGGSMYPVVWSPDSSRLAFVYYTSFGGGEPAADVYVVGRDGRNLTQVYKGVTVGSVLFSPDGLHLLIDETTSPTGGHLFIVNLDTLANHILEAPGLSLDTDWYAPAWRSPKR